MGTAGKVQLSALAVRVVRQRMYSTLVCSFKMRRSVEGRVAFTTRTAVNPHNLAWYFASGGDPCCYLFEHFRQNSARVAMW